MTKSKIDLRRKACSINEACELVGVSRRTIYNWIEAGKIETYLTAGAGIRIYEDSLVRERKP